MTDFARRYPWLIFRLATFCLILLGGLLFRDFVFGDRVLLYRDIGSDSSTDYFPWFVHFSDYIRSEGMPSSSRHALRATSRKSFRAARARVSQTAIRLLSTIGEAGIDRTREKYPLSH